MPGPYNSWMQVSSDSLLCWFLAFVPWLCCIRHVVYLGLVVVFEDTEIRFCEEYSRPLTRAL